MFANERDNQNKSKAVINMILQTILAGEGARDDTSEEALNRRRTALSSQQTGSQPLVNQPGARARSIVPL